MSGKRDIPLDVVSEILSGRIVEHVVTHPGRSQYSRIGGGVSACGLAALNCARVVLGMEQMGVRNNNLLQEIMNRRTLEDVLRPCLSWTSTAHLDVEEIHQAPIFNKSLKLLSRDFGHSGFENFKRLLLRMREHTRTERASTCAIITRPPEILACIHVASSKSEIFVIFDSHPRPDKHPHGAAFIFTSSIDSTAKYLDDLLRYDDSILSDTTLEWQAQLLAQFSGHIFAAQHELVAPTAWAEIALQASLDVLMLKEQAKELELRNSTLSSENERLNEEVSRLEDRVAEMVEEKRRKKSRVTSTHYVNNTSSSRSKGKERESPGLDIKHSGRSSSDRVASASGSSQSSRQVGQHNDSAALQMHLNEERFQSEAYAMAQQRKYDEEHAKLNQVFEDLKRREPGVFKCGICFDDFQEDVVARVQPCHHPFCRGCLNGYVGMKVTERRYPISCPQCVAEKATDPGVVDEVMLTQLGLSQEQYDIFVEMQLAAFSIIIHCRRCKESIFVDKNEYQETEILVCPLQRCNYTWCKACSQQIDIGGPQHSCDGSSELKHLMGQRGWKHCPGCKTPAEKIEGCNHMTCSAPGCNTHFCYKCGGSIIQSVKREEISTAVSAHYRRLCELFEYPGRLTR